MIRVNEAMAERIVRLLDVLVERQDGSALPIIATELRSQLRQLIDEPNHLPDLLDTVVQMLMDPRHRQLSTSMTEHLRRSILSPLELAKFKRNLVQGRSCTDCRRELLDEEIIAIYQGSIYCTRCFPPRRLYCPQCENVIDASGVAKTLERLMAKHESECEARRSQDGEPRVALRRGAPQTIRRIMTPTPQAPQAPQVTEAVPVLQEGRPANPNGPIAQMRTFRESLRRPDEWLADRTVTPEADTWISLVDGREAVEPVTVNNTGASEIRFVRLDDGEADGG